jgi:hypothetical protein
MKCAVDISSGMMMKATMYIYIYIYIYIMTIGSGIQLVLGLLPQ